MSMPNRPSGQHIEPAEREKLMWEAFELSAKRWKKSEIARHLGVTRATITRWIDRAAEAFRKENAAQGPLAVQFYLDVQRETQETIEAILADPKRSNWRELPALERVKIEAQEKIDLIGGWRAPIKSAVAGKVHHEMKYVDTDAMTQEQVEEYLAVLEKLPMKELE